MTSRWDTAAINATLYAFNPQKTAIVFQGLNDLPELLHDSALGLGLTNHPTVDLDPKPQTLV